MATKTEEVAQKILSTLDTNKETINSYTFAKETGEDHQLVIGAIKSLQSLGNVRSIRGRIVAILFASCLCTWCVSITDERVDESFNRI